jgi:hypothetical protein
VYFSITDTYCDAIAGDDTSAVPAVTVFVCISSPLLVCQEQPNHNDAPAVRHVAEMEVFRLGTFCPSSFASTFQPGSLIPLESLAEDVE